MQKANSLTVDECRLLVAAIAKAELDGNHDAAVYLADLAADPAQVREVLRKASKMQSKALGTYPTKTLPPNAPSAGRASVNPPRPSQAHEAIGAVPPPKAPKVPKSNLNPLPVKKVEAPKVPKTPEPVPNEHDEIVKPPEGIEDPEKLIPTELSPGGQKLQKPIPAGQTPDEAVWNRIDEILAQEGSTDAALQEAFNLRAKAKSPEDEKLYDGVVNRLIEIQKGNVVPSPKLKINPPLDDAKKILDDAGNDFLKADKAVEDQMENQGTAVRGKGDAQKHWDEVRQNLKNAQRNELNKQGDTGQFFAYLLNNRSLPESLEHVREMLRNSHSPLVRNFLLQALQLVDKNAVMPPKIPHALTYKGPVEPPSAKAIPPSPERQILKESPVVSGKKIGVSANLAFLLDLGNGNKGVFKPVSGEEKFEHYIGESVPLYVRGATVSDLGSILGLGKMVPQTVIRDVEGDVGSLQTFVEGGKTAAQISNENPGRFTRENMPVGNDSAAVALAAAFDYLIGNPDRHENNWMISKDGELVLIDPDLAFPSKNTKGLIPGYMMLLKRAAEWQEKIPKVIKKWQKSWPTFSKLMLERGFSEDEVRATGERLNDLGKARYFTDLLLNGVWGVEEPKPKKGPK